MKIRFCWLFGGR